jgi:glutaminyl-tRNA synthetase
MPESEVTRDSAPKNFIAEEIRKDLAAGRYTRPICTRFPPEPNGYMHLGHAFAATVGYGLAKEFSGLFNLRFDDTNPAAEEEEFVAAMEHDVQWLLDAQLGGRVFHASDYYEQLYEWALQLVDKGMAYVDSLSPEQIKEYRGDFYKPGRDSPYRQRSAEENRRLLEAMREGKHNPGEMVLRAKIDMASANLNLRDPLIYRIMKEEHHRAGAWHIYPLYDYAHPLSDAIEGVTHSTCGKEFANHRPLYDWFLEQLELKEPPRQIEFAEIGITGIVLSKRYLRRLVEQGTVGGWDDPRMPTIRGLRRRGYPAQAIRNFCRALGVSNSSPGTVDISLLEHFVREELNASSPRVMAVLEPLKVVIENYPEDRVEEFTAENMPKDPSFGTRNVSFCREIYVERSDFMEDPPKKYYRLSPGSEVRLRAAYLITCKEAIKDPQTGEVIELRATYDPETRSGQAPDGRKVKGTLHWVSARDHVKAEVRMYGRLFGDDFENHFDGSQPIEQFVDPESLKVLPDAVIESSVKSATPGQRYQFERMGYFCADTTHTAHEPVFNQTVGLRDKKFSRIFNEPK